jgi:hypothetical protein
MIESTFIRGDHKTAKVLLEELRKKLATISIDYYVNPSIIDALSGNDEGDDGVSGGFIEEEIE